MAQVNMPNQRESDLDTILKGLQVAGGIYGIYTNHKELELKKAQMDQLKTEKDAEKSLKADQSAGILTPGATKEGEYKGDIVSEIPIPGSVKRQVRGADGSLTEVHIKPAHVSEAEKKAKADAVASAITAESRNFEKDKYVASEIDKFKTDDQVQDILKKSSASKSVAWLLKQKQPNLDAAALAAVFKMSGDVGAVRQEDRDNFGLSPALQAQAQATLQRLQNGQVIAPEERANLIKWTSMIDFVAKRDIQKLAETRSSNIAKTSHKDKKEILNMLNPVGMLPEDFETATESQISGERQNISSPSIPGESKGFATPSNENDDDFLKRYLNK